MAYLKKIKDFNMEYKSILETEISDMKKQLSQIDEMRYNHALLNFKLGMKAPDARAEVKLTSGQINKMNKLPLAYAVKSKTNTIHPRKHTKLIKYANGETKYIPIEEFNQMKLNDQLELKERKPNKKVMNKEIRGGVLVKDTNSDNKFNSTLKDYALSRLKE